LLYCQLDQELFVLDQVLFFERDKCKNKCFLLLWIGGGLGDGNCVVLELSTRGEVNQWSDVRIYIRLNELKIWIEFFFDM